jgi:hypothetical protein
VCNHFWEQLLVKYELPFPCSFHATHAISLVKRTSGNAFLAAGKLEAEASASDNRRRKRGFVVVE